MTAQLTPRHTGPSIYRWPVLRILRSFTVGALSVQFPEGKVEVFGVGEPTASIVIHDEEFFKNCALFGGVGLGESYTDGLWDSPDVRSALAWFIVNLHANPKLAGSSQRFISVGLLKLANRVGHLLRRNTKDGSSRNIVEHYDLGNDFYKLWLDLSLREPGASPAEQVRSPVPKAPTHRH
jgi:cyclopropane-fatty-acyl-phospholipid synthase